MRLLVIFTFVSSSSFAQSANEKEVLSISARKFVWMQNKQLDSLEAILDDRLMYIHSNGWVETKSEVIDDLKNGKLTYKQVKVIESNVRLWDDTAIVTGKGIFNVVLDGKPLEFNLGFSEVYILQYGKWKLVSRHANRML